MQAPRTLLCMSLVASATLMSAGCAAGQDLDTVIQGLEEAGGEITITTDDGREVTVTKAMAHSPMPPFTTSSRAWGICETSSGPSISGSSSPRSWRTA
ncbi:MAG: hypothetical protein WD645_06570 [Dehalococcoidia bacterium]